VTGRSEPSESGFDRLAVAFSTGLSRRQVAKLAAGLALSSLVPGVARAARWPRARAADKTRGSCPPQARKECSSGALRGDWVHGCAESAAKGVASTFNGCGPEAGIPVSLFDHEFARGDYIPDNPFYLGHFFSACQGHDCCYGQCGGNKAQCDSDFLAKMRAACDTRWPLKTIADSIIYGQMAALCYAVADAYYDAVSTTTTGQDAYDAGQKAVCDCCIDCPTQAKLLGYLDYNHWAVCPRPRRGDRLLVHQPVRERGQLRRLRQDMPAAVRRVRLPGGRLSERRLRLSTRRAGLLQRLPGPRGLHGPGAGVVAATTTADPACSGPPPCRRGGGRGGPSSSAGRARAGAGSGRSRGSPGSPRARRCG
jgi:hypothetical protein